MSTVSFMIILALQIIVYSMTDNTILRLPCKDKVNLKVRALTHFSQAPLQMQKGSINRVKMVSLK